MSLYKEVNIDILFNILAAYGFASQLFLYQKQFESYSKCIGYWADTKLECHILDACGISYSFKFLKEKLHSAKFIKIAWGNFVNWNYGAAFSNILADGGWW